MSLTFLFGIADCTIVSSKLNIRIFIPLERNSLSLLISITHQNTILDFVTDYNFCFQLNT